MLVQIIVVSPFGTNVPVDDKSLRDYFMKAKGVERAFFSKAERTVVEHAFACDKEAKAVLISVDDSRIKTDIVTIIYLNPAPHDTPRSTEFMTNLQNRLTNMTHETGEVFFKPASTITMIAETDVIDVWHMLQGELKSNA